MKIKSKASILIVSFGIGLGIALSAHADYVDCATLPDRCMKLVADGNFQGAARCWKLFEEACV